MLICERLMHLLTKTYGSMEKKSKLKSYWSIHAVHGQHSISRKEKVDESCGKGWRVRVAPGRAAAERNRGEKLFI
jgi:predicted  nucleic acid-binding Zn ribbon protein